MKSFFYGQLVAEHLEGKWWKIINSPVFYSSNYNITIFSPPMFVTDFASVPRVPLAYMLTGNTGHWEALMHDVIYRFSNERLMADNIFYEAGRVRAKMRAEQSWWLDKGRMLRSGLMAGMTAAVGWAVHSPSPGCLDTRQMNNCEKKCASCNLFYPLWKHCIVSGCVPDINMEKI